MAAVTSVVRVQQIMMARVEEALRQHDLTFARYELLTLLFFSRTGALPLSRIGSRLQVHPASVTNAVDRCESRGWVRRVPHPTDRRTTLAELSPSGRLLVAKATAAVNSEVFQNLGLSGRDLRTLLRRPGPVPAARRRLLIKAPGSARRRWTAASAGAGAKARARKNTETASTTGTTKPARRSLTVATAPTRTAPTSEPR